MARVIKPKGDAGGLAELLRDAVPSLTADQLARLTSQVDQATPFLVDSDGFTLPHANEYLRKRCKGRLEAFSFRRLAENSINAYADDLAYFLNTYSEPSPELLALNAKNGELLHSYINHLESPEAELSASTISRRSLIAREFVGFLDSVLNDGDSSINEQARGIRRTIIGDADRKISYFATAALPASRRRSPTLIYVLPPNQLRAFLDSFLDESHRLIAMLIFATGMRRSEVVRITVGQVMGLRPIHPGGPAPLTITGKGRKTRTIEIESLALRLMQRALTAKERMLRLKSSPVLRAKAPGDIPLFINQLGMPMSGAAVADAFRRASDRCGIKRTPHELRHEFATNYLLSAYREIARRISSDKFGSWLARLMIDKASLVILRLARLMGHSDPETTKRIYLSSLLNSDPGIRDAWCRHLDSLDMDSMK